MYSVDEHGKEDTTPHMQGTYEAGYRRKEHEGEGEVQRADAQRQHIGIMETRRRRRNGDRRNAGGSV